MAVNVCAIDGNSGTHDLNNMKPTCVFCCILLCAHVHQAVLFSNCPCTVQQFFAAIIAFIFTFYNAFVLRRFYHTKYSYCIKY